MAKQLSMFLLIKNYILNEIIFEFTLLINIINLKMLYFLHKIIIFKIDGIHNE